jgi:hypothetical protein
LNIPPSYTTLNFETKQNPIKNKITFQKAFFQSIKAALFLYAFSALHLTRPLNIRAVPSTIYPDFQHIIFTEKVRLEKNAHIVKKQHCQLRTTIRKIEQTPKFEPSKS